MEQVAMETNEAPAGLAGALSPWVAPETIASVQQTLAALRDQGLALANQRPVESLVALVAGGAALYYAAERGRNERVHTYWDALEFVSTCASVGYSNIFPNTPVGKIVASVLFLLGPALAAAALERPHSPQSPAEGVAADLLPPGQAALALRLEAILRELKDLNANLRREPDGTG